MNEDLSYLVEEQLLSYGILEEDQFLIFSNFTKFYHYIKNQYDILFKSIDF